MIEKLLHAALAATFPASDALSLTQPGGGRQSTAPAPRFSVRGRIHPREVPDDREEALHE